MKHQRILDNQRILITGGTGSFGNEVVDKLLEETNPKEIIIFSRDEKKQYDMRNKYNNPKLTFIIGDVRDRNSVFDVMDGADFVFHAAALKQVPTCEFFPMQAVQTNILGTANVLDAAEHFDITKVVVLSTDKSVYPINAMGMTKALLEKLMLAKARNSKSNTVFCGVRYGNVMYSRGSVFPLFADQMYKRLPLTMTVPEMTRYLLPLPVAIELVLFALEEGQNGDLLVRKSPAATVQYMAEAMIEIFKYDLGTKVIGIREGEKMHETLVTREELLKAESYDLYYRIKTLDQINYDDYFSHGVTNEIPEEGYTSENTARLTKKETVDLLLSLKEIQSLIQNGLNSVVAQ